MATQPSPRGRGRPPHPDILTPREWQVLDLLRQGLTNERIAERLDISFATAKYHVAEIISKLGVHTREEAAAWQPEAVAARWWQRATAWVPRRAWPLAGAAGALAALAMLAAVLWSMQDDAETSVVAQPTPSQDETISPTPAPSSLVPSTVPTPRPSLDLGVYSVASDSQALRTLLPGFKTRDVTPAGRYIAGAEFCAAPGHLELVDTQSGITRQLATFDGIVARIEIAPDGNHVLAGVQSPEHSQTPLLYLIPTQGEASPLPLFEAWDAEWSPDSHYIRLIDAPVTGESTLSLYEVATGANTTLVSAPYLSSAIWSPDSAVIAYSTAIDSTGAPNELFLWDRITGTSESLPIKGVPAAWFPDGQSIAVLEPGGQNSPVTRVWIDGSRSELLGEASGFAISPDGSTIARRIFTEPQKTELRITGKGSEIVIAGPVEPAGDMAFSPDSRALAFIGQEYHRSGGQIVDATGINPYVVNADGSNVRKLADTVQSVILGWTANGDVLFASVRGTGCEEPFG
jgi:DNA-binding CsgD family transcriptional regulator